MNRWKEFAGFIGVEFGKPFKAKGSNETLIIADDGPAYVNDNGTYDKDNVLALHLIEGKIEPIKYPKEGDLVWMVTPLVENGYYVAYWKKDYGRYKLAFDRGFVFETKEEAEAKVKELGW